MKPPSDYLAKIGSKGGKATGKRKARGDAAYYRKLALKSAAAKRKRRTDEGTE